MSKEDGRPQVHTPGPWRLCDEKSGRDNFASSIYGNGHDGLLVARGSQNGNHRQDMILIAAVPDMLRLLREAQFYLEPSPTRDAIDKLFASINPKPAEPDSRSVPDGGWN